MFVIASIVGGTAGESVPLHWTPSSFLIAVAGAEMFVKSSLPLSRFVTLRSTLAAMLLKFATDAMQCATPVRFGNVVGAQSWVSVTAPCRLKKATGIVTGFFRLPLGSSVIRPKYCPLASSGPLIVIQRSVVFLL